MSYSNIQQIVAINSPLGCKRNTLSVREKEFPLRISDYRKQRAARGWDSSFLDAINAAVKGNVILRSSIFLYFGETSRIASL